MYNLQELYFISIFYTRLIQSIGGKNIWYIPIYNNNIFNKISVNIIANILFQYIYLNNHKIIYIFLLYYIPKMLK
jgi:hypothetical protein